MLYDRNKLFLRDLKFDLFDNTDILILISFEVDFSRISKLDYFSYNWSLRVILINP